MKKIPKFLFFYKWTYSVQLKPEQGTRQFVFTSWQWQGIKVSATTRQILASKSLDNVFRDNATAKWNISRFFAPSSFGPLSCPLAGDQISCMWGREGVSPVPSPRALSCPLAGGKIKCVLGIFFIGFFHLVHYNIENWVWNLARTRRSVLHAILSCIIIGELCPPRVTVHSWTIIVRI